MHSVLAHERRVHDTNLQGAFGRQWLTEAAKTLRN
jgi:hypothetical protein